MGSFHLPFRHAVAQTRGAAAATAIPMRINAGDTILAVIEHDSGSGHVAGLDPAAFSVSDGEIESATLDTSGKFLIVVHTS